MCEKEVQTMSQNITENYDIKDSKTKKQTAGEEDVLSDEELESILSLPVFDFARYATRIVRPYGSGDFTNKEYFIPDLSLAVPLAIGAAMKFAPMVQYVLMNAHQM